MIRRILIAGAGNMGAWLAETMCLEYEVAVYDKEPDKLKYLFNTYRFRTLGEIGEYNPQLFINAVGLKDTEQAFKEIIPYLPKDCIIADISSVKNGLSEFYASSGMRFVSTHPMFGTTFGNVRDLSGQNAIIISESDIAGKEFFARFYTKLKLELFEYTFFEHDQTIAYSLSVPFSSTIVFSACMKKLEVPGTTFRKHLNIAHGLLSEDDYLLSGILLNPYSIGKLSEIMARLKDLINMLNNEDEEGLHTLFRKLRINLGMLPEVAESEA
ncbi:MAG TPA: prephenate dehydrogenase/arogenate dehydrogenase family protein [Bacteroidales bacterium]|nr:prephenate dehydrogenase/arogenate dehydrogenase family protein [Bacteroidales bacterium]